MTNRIFTSAVLGVLAASLSAAAGVDGKWTAEVPGRRGPMEMVFDLKADGDKVTGTISNDFMGKSEIQDGKIKGDEVSFKQVLEMGRTLTFTYTGKIKGDEIEFTRAMEGGFGGRGPGGGGPGAGGGRRGGDGGEDRARGGEGRPGGGGEGRRGGRGGGFGRPMTFTAKRVK